MAPLKLCRDCRFFKRRLLTPNDLIPCGHQQAVEGTTAQLVDGRAPRRRRASDMRYDSAPCGNAGKLWEPR